MLVRMHANAGRAPAFGVFSPRFVRQNFPICAPPAWVAAYLQMLRNMPDTPQLPAATLALCYVPFTAFLIS